MMIFALVSISSVIISILCLGAGGAIGVLFFKRSSSYTELVSFKKKAEQLEFDKKLLMRAQDTSLLVLDSSGAIKLANNFAFKFFQKKEIEGRHYKEVVTNEKILKVIEEAIKKKKPIKKELRVTVQSEDFQMGEERALFINIKFLEDENHERFTRIYIYDNTEQFRADQVRKDFVANASHELRTPLAIINGYVETLMDEDTLQDTETSMRFLGIMKRHGQRITRVIEEMLLISKLESGISAALKITPFSVRDCIDDCLIHLEPLIKERGAAVKVTMSEPELTIKADRFYWNQILFNLIENAIKQNPNKEQLKIKVGCAQTKSGEIRIWVSDDGVGIPASDLPFIFRRFYRVEKHHNQQKIKGTGLGLSIVKRAVEAHNGTIHCDSVQNQITRFTITLPASARVIVVL